MNWYGLPPRPVNLHSWVKGLYEGLGRRPDPRLSQVFLVDGRGIEVFASRVSELLDYPLAEVGVGPGHLAYYVAGRVGGVVGVEIDPDLARIAAVVLSGTGSSVVYGDGVEFIAASRVPSYYSNTPYAASSRLLSATARNNSVERALLGLQLEVARRVLAEPGSSEYGRLTLLVDRYFEAVEVARLPREWFYPRPEVHGSLVYLERVRPWAEGDECFERLTACLYTGRNKLADKMAAKCLGIERGLLSRIAGRRVDELTAGDVEWLMEKAGGCTIRG